MQERGRLGDPMSPLRLASAVAILVALLGLVTWAIGRAGDWTPSLLLATIPVLAIAFSVGTALLASQQRLVDAVDEARAELAALHGELEMQQHDIENADHDIKRTSAALGAAVHALEREGTSPEIAMAISGQLDTLRQLLRPPRSTRLESVPLSDLVAPIENFAALHGLEVRADLSEDVHAELDVSKAIQILQNLIDNARKYAGGSPIEVWDESEGPIVRIIVEDRGPGIGGDPEAMFQPGARTSSSAQGFGMGLAVSRRLAEAMQGALWYERRAGRGARFVLKVRRSGGSEP
jgi:signal transduction histidine kinase